MKYQRGLIMCKNNSRKNAYSGGYSFLIEL